MEESIFHNTISKEELIKQLSDLIQEAKKAEISEGEFTDLVKGFYKE